ncbi:MAG: hypothetical protein Q9201_006950 [Fulgogasparrea decipioides]
MFSSLGLFKQTPCPEYPDCVLKDCLFAHESISTFKKNGTSQKKLSAAHTLENEDTVEGADGPRKRRRIVKDDQDNRALQEASNGWSRSTSSSETPQIKEKTDALRSVTDNALPKTAARPISPPPPRAPRGLASKLISKENSKAVNAQTDPTKEVGLNVPPTVKKGVLSKTEASEETLNPRMLPNPPVSHQTRMKLITMLHEQMARLNAELRGSEDASKEALTLSEAELITEALNEEFQIAKKSSVVYLNLIKSRVMVLKKMKLDIWIQERTKKIAEKLPAGGRMKPSAPKTIETGLMPTEEAVFVPRLAAQQEGLSKHGYVTIVPTDSEIEMARKGIESSNGWEECDRCTTRFQVFPGRRAEDGALTSGGTCTYHWAKPRRPPTVKGDKPRDLIYACCDQTVGVSTGCTKGNSHVFKISDPKRLALVMPFVSTPVTDRSNLPRAVCFDCEMGYSTQGMELIRLTATAWPDGRELLDVLVRPLGEILDLNSRFSGVWPDDYANAVPFDDPSRGESRNSESQLQLVESPAKAREMLFELLTPETPLIGHALENDLNAVRILHPVIVDTCLLFPHPRGLPLRFGLKMLMKKYLDRDIQTGGAQGHDSKEDARAAGDLVRYRIGELWQKMKGQGWTIRGDEFCPPLPPLV